jgi:hypothetical protein
VSAVMPRLYATTGVALRVIGSLPRGVPLDTPIYLLLLYKQRGGVSVVIYR